MGFKLGLLTWEVAYIQPQHDVLFDRAPGQEQRLLRHIASVTGANTTAIAIDSNQPRRRLIHTGNDIKKRTFAATTGSNHGDKFTCVHLQINRRQGGQDLAPILIGFRDFLYQKFRRFHTPHLPSFEHTKSRNPDMEDCGWYLYAKKTCRVNLPSRCRFPPLVLSRSGSRNIEYLFEYSEI